MIVVLVVQMEVVQMEVDVNITSKYQITVKLMGCDEV